MNSLKTIICALTLPALAAACVQSEPVRTKADFGQSVRHMIQAQILDPGAAERHGQMPPVGLDGGQSEAVYKSYREDVAKPGAVKQDDPTADIIVTQ